jgi:hypothetical protein
LNTTYDRDEDTEEEDEPDEQVMGMKTTKRKMNLNMTPTIMVTMTTIRTAPFSPGREERVRLLYRNNQRCNDSKNCL